MKCIYGLKSIGYAGLLVFATAQAEAIINNGGFESGFADWTRVDQAGSEGTFHEQTGTTSPINGDPVPAPPGGSTAAMTDAFAGGAHVLYQDFTVGSPVGPTFLSFDLFIGNRADDFYVPVPATLDWATPELNQQARVDILLASSDPFSVDPGDVLLTVLQTVPGQALVSGYRHHSVDITDLLNNHLNTPLRLRFAETDNVFIFQLGVDNVSIAAAVPDAVSMSGALALAFISLCCSRRALQRPGL